MKHKFAISTGKNLPKPGESISFKNGLVIKHFDDGKIVADRVERAKILGNIVPKIVQSSKYSYAYKFIDGELISKINDVKKFEEFLVFCKKNLWKKRSRLDSGQAKEFLEKTKKFYFDKTHKRLRKFYADTGIKDQAEVINGKKVPTLKSLLKKIDWNWLTKGVPVLFHGDLQPENILVTSKGFKLLDWRHDFEGLKAYGDIYYDFAKLYHALIISHEVIRKEEYSVKEEDQDIEFQFLMKSNLLEFKDVFENWLIKNDYDLRKVKVLSAMIYLNIAPLHHYPYNKLLYYLGKRSLYDIL
ncbi:MAG: phosphotransferase [Candidatus Zambryskibacteria bacterium]|nr:phosphotransferase [Candidatus Zambryskibacteria bacterium]